MRSPAPGTITPEKWEALSTDPTPDPQQLDNMKAHLDLVMLALESLTGKGSEAALEAAEQLGLAEAIANRISLWRLRQSNPLRKSSGGRKKLDVEEARSLVLIICHLAHQDRELIRRGVGMLEQMTAQNQPPHQSALLGDYLDTFTNTYEERMESPAVSPSSLTHLALKLLIDLLFYSHNQGHRRLWLALLDYAS